VLKKTNLFKIIIFITAVFCLVQCKKGGGGSQTMVFSPVVNVECDAGDYPVCQSSSVTTLCSPINNFHSYGTITRQFCNQIDVNYIAQSSQELLCNSFGCYGTLSFWKNEQGVDVDQILGGVSRICVFIDTNCNGKRDTGDLIFYTEVDIHDNTPTVDAVQWTAF